MTDQTKFMFWLPGQIVPVEIALTENEIVELQSKRLIRMDDRGVYCFTDAGAMIEKGLAHEIQ